MKSRPDPRDSAATDKEAHGSPQPVPRPEEWTLNQRARLSMGEEIAYDVFGQGPPVVLVHGMPSRSWIWSALVPALAAHHAVHLFDLLTGNRRARHRWCGGAADTFARAHSVLMHRPGGRDRLATMDHTGHQAQANVRRGVLNDAEHVFASTIVAHLRTATARPLGDASFAAVFGQWEGEEGQARCIRDLEQFDERFTAGFEPRLGSMQVPVRIVRGERDAWLPPSIAYRLRALIPGAELAIIPGAGHFSMLGRSDEMVRELLRYFDTA